MIFLLPAYFTNPIVRDGSGSSVVIKEWNSFMGMTILSVCLSVCPSVLGFLLAL
jgi:hypothetical protein